MSATFAFFFSLLREKLLASVQGDASGLMPEEERNGGAASMMIAHTSAGDHRPSRPQAAQATAWVVGYLFRPVLYHICVLAWDVAHLGPWPAGAGLPSPLEPASQIPRGDREFGSSEQKQRERERENSLSAIRPGPSPIARLAVGYSQKKKEKRLAVGRPSISPIWRAVHCL